MLPYSTVHALCTCTDPAFSTITSALSLSRTAFATYLLAILLYIFNVRQGAWFTVITGCLMILANFSFGIIIINDPPLELPFQDAILKPAFGWSWWLVLWTGIGCFFLGFFLIFLDRFWPNKSAIIFHHSLVEDDQFFAVENEEEAQPKLEDYGVGAPGLHRGQVGRSSRGRTRRGLKSRSQHDKPGSQKRASAVVEVETIQLEEIATT